MILGRKEGVLGQLGSLEGETEPSRGWLSVLDRKLSPSKAVDKEKSRKEGLSAKVVGNGDCDLGVGP